MKNPLTKFNRKLRRGIFTLTPKFLVATMILSTIFSASYNPQKVEAATCVTLSGSYTVSTFNAAVAGCTSGSNDILVNSAVTFAAGTYNIGSANLVIGSSGVLTISSSSTTGTGATGVIISGTGNVTIASGGSINGNGRGYSGGTGSAYGYGEGGGGAAYWYGNGGSHGGVGGFGNGSTPAAGAVNDTYNGPVRPGSGGGGLENGGGTGTAGGGAVKISTTGIVSIDGSISMNGNNFTTTGNACPGMGAGGSIWIEAGTITTASTSSNPGSLSANGGSLSNINGCGTNLGGGGGGGRIYLNSTYDTYNGSITVQGGLGGQSGEAGSVQRNVVNPGNITVYNGQTVTWTRTNSSSNSGGDFKFFNLTVNGGGTITTGTAQLGGGSNNNMIPNNFSGFGPNPGYSGFGGGGGGGHANAGESSAVAVGGTSDGGGSQITSPTLTGSAGGGNKAYSNYASGGSGGGALKLTITGTLTNNGTISASGSNSGPVDNATDNFAGGGGSGGSLWINAPTGIVSGSGTYSAAGGSSTAPNSNKGGGGSGGRISFTSGFTSSSFTPTLNVNGGSLANSNTPGAAGGRGTISGVAFSSINSISSYVNSLSSITGTALDYGGGTISSLNIYLKNNTDNTCYNGSIWTTCTSSSTPGSWPSFPATNTGSSFSTWSRAVPALTSGKSYTVLSSINGTETPGSGRTFTFDNVAPTVALTYGSSIAKAGTNLITATYSEAPSSAPTISINQPGSTDISNAAMSGSGTVYTYSYTVVAANGSTYIDGTATVSLSATTDAAGNSSGSPTGTTFVIDTTGPTVSIGSPSSSITRSGPITYTVTYADNNAVAAVTLANANVTLNTTGTATGTIAVSGSGTSTRTVTISSITGNGTLGISIASGTATDSATNSATASSASTTFTVDNSGPTVALTYGSSIAKAGTNLITATYSEAPSSAPTISINQPGSTDISNAAMSGSGTVYTYSYTVVAANGTTYVDGTATVSLSATTDAAGNSSGSPTGSTFAIDTTGPTTSDNYGVKSGEWQNSNQTITLTPADATSGVASTKYCTSSISCDPSSGTTYTAPVLINTQGTSYFRYSSTDNAGNVQSTNALTIKIDTTAPVAATSISPTVGTGNVFQYVTNYNLTWTAGTDNGANASGLATTPYTISRYDTALACAAGTGGNKKVLGTADTNSFSTSATPADQSALSPGDNWIGIMTTDNAGNSIYGCSGAYINIDNNAPTVPGTPATSTTPLSDSTPTWTWTASTDSESNMASTGSYAVQWATDTGFTQNVGSGTSNTNSYTHSSILANGTWYFKVKAIDRALNESSYSSYGTVVIDTTAPLASTITTICSVDGNGCTPGGISADPQEVYNLSSLTGAASDNVGGSGVQKVEISIQNKGAANASDGSYFGSSEFDSVSENYITVTYNNGAWSYNTSAVSAAFVIGDYYKINVRTTDNAGNVESSVVTKTFQFTNEPPEMSITGSTTQDVNGSISVTFNTSDSGSSQTENSMFYRSGVTLGANITNPTSTGNITLSSSVPSYFPASGTIMIDNEIITYTGKSGSTLTGILRGKSANSGYQTTKATHTAGAAVYVHAPSATGDDVSNVGSGKTISWVVSSDASGYEYDSSALNPSIKIVVNDGASGNMIAVDTADIDIDAKAPASGLVTFDSGVGSLSESGVITITKPSDMSTVSYRIQDTNTNSSPDDTGWESITENTTIPWTFDSDEEAKSITYQFKDSYGNTTSEVTTSSLDPISASTFLIQDTSNINVSPLVNQLYISWQQLSAPATGFDSYVLEYSSSTNGTTYSSYSSVDDPLDTLNSYSTNYYIHKNLTSTTYYKYRLGVKSTSGNTSLRIGESVLAKPDGSPNYGEGAGSSVNASVVENVIPTQDSDTKDVTITYKLTDSTNDKKTNPNYDARVFYNVGTVLGANPLVNSTTLKLSSTAKLKTAGYIKINNEILKYTGISGNNLTGVVRATWADDTRSTRSNGNNLLAGTPVWIMASSTSNNAITDVLAVSNSTIKNSGYNGSIVWTVYNETALAGSLYTTLPISVLVHDGQDALSAPLSSQSDYSETGTLNDFDLTAPTIGFSSTTSSGSESSTPATFTLSLSRAYPINSTVSYTVTGTATGSGTDYTLANGTATITAGQTSVNLDAVINNDSIKEGDETIIVTISSPSGSILGVNTAHTYTITDDDNAPVIAFDATTSSGSESATTVNIPVSVDSISGTDITVAYAVTGGTATGSGTDYTLVSGTATITAGQTSTNISISVVNDQSYESNETIIVTISNPSGATLGVNRSHTYTITEDDSAPVVAFSSASTSGSESTTTVNIPVSINFASYQNVSVDYTVTGGTATGSGTDYTLASGTATITAGQTSTNIVVTVVDDLIDEENETIEITLSPSPVNATLGDTTVHTYTIADNDSSTTVGFDTTSSSGSESSTSFNIPVTVSASSGLDVTVDYAITGTAIGSGTDYTLASGTATIVAGQTSVNIPVSVIDDSLDENDETIIITLSSPTNASLGANTAYTYTITDNDTAPTIGFTTDNDSSIENATPAAKTIGVSLVPASGKSVTVAYTITTNGTAILNTDFTATNTTGTLTIVPGSTTASIPFTVINDTDFETEKTIIVTLSSPNNATLGTSTFTYTITNDDIEADTTAPIFTFDADQGITPVSTDVYSIDIVKGATFNFPTYTVSDNVTALESITVTKSTDTISTANVTTTPIVVTYTVQDGATPKNTKIVTLRVNVILAASYIVTVTAGANGTVDADDTTKALTGYSATGSVYTIPRATTTTGNNATFTITPASGYSIDVLTVGDETRANNSTSVSFTDIQENKTINVSFAENLDITAPVITLLGESPIDVTLGDVYTDDGITAVEDNDVSCTEGDTTTTPQAGCRWSKSGTVNTAAVSGNTPYKIIYKAINSRGLVSTAERIVNVVYADTYDLTLTVTGSGVVKNANGDTISAGSVVVDSLSTPVYTFVPDTDLHKVKTLSVTIGGTTTPLNVDDYQAGYTFSQIKGDVSMAVTFGLISAPAPQITFKNPGAVSLSVNDPYPTTDWDATYSPDEGVTVINLVVDGQEAIPGKVSKSITGNSTGSGVSGAEVTYSVTYTDGVDGTVTGTATRILNVTDNVAPIISNISTPIKESDVVMVKWDTNESTNTQIYWDVNSHKIEGDANAIPVNTLGSYAHTSELIDDPSVQTTSNVRKTIGHWTIMDGLTANTKYYYVVVSADASGNIATSTEQEVTTAQAGEVIVINSGGGGGGGVSISTYEALQRELEELKKNSKAGLTTLPEISNIKISDVTAFGATISFDTDRLTVAGVDYGKTKDFGKTEGNFKWSTNHKINIGGLTVGTDYYYGIAVVDKYSNIGVSVGDKQVFKTKFFSENLDEINKIENVEQFQNEIESSIESILPSLVPPFVEAPVVTEITEDSAVITYKTNIKGFSLVSYATDDFYDETNENPYNGEVSDTTGKVLTHKVKLINLKSNTKYHFSAKAFSLPQIVGKSKDFTFTTKASKIKVSVTSLTKNSFTVSWNTNGKTSSIVEYKNLKTGKVNKRTDDTRSTGHSVKIENLDPGTLYQVDASGLNEIGNTVEGSGTITIKTLTDVTAPTISKVKVDSSLVVGRNDKTQTIISWKTDEPSTSVVYYEEGSGSPDKALANKQEDTELTLNHVVILTTLKPGTVYRFQVASSDDANNVKKLPIRTIITPRPSESIVDVIFKNFNESFNFINNVK